MPGRLQCITIARTMMIYYARASTGEVSATDRPTDRPADGRTRIFATWHITYKQVINHKRLLSRRHLLHPPAGWRDTSTATRDLPSINNSIIYIYIYIRTRATPRTHKPTLLQPSKADSDTEFQDYKGILLFKVYCESKNWNFLI